MKLIKKLIPLLCAFGLLTNTHAQTPLEKQMSAWLAEVETALKVDENNIYDDTVIARLESITKAKAVSPAELLLRAKGGYLQLKPFANNVPSMEAPIKAKHTAKVNMLITDITKVIKANPQNINNHLFKATLYKDLLLDYVKAMASYTEVIKIDPNNAEAINGRMAYNAYGLTPPNYKKCIADAVLLMQLDSLNWQEHYNLGMVYANKITNANNEIDMSGIAEMETAYLKRKSDSTKVMEIATRYMDKKNYPEALKWYKQIFNNGEWQHKYPINQKYIAVSLENQLKIFQELKKYDSAINVINDMLDGRFNANDWLANQAIEAYSKVYGKTITVEAFKTAHSTFQKQTESFDNGAAAREGMLNAINLNPYFSPLYAKLGSMYSYNKMYDSATYYFEQAYLYDKAKQKYDLAASEYNMYASQQRTEKAMAELNKPNELEKAKFNDDMILKCAKEVNSQLSKIEGEAIAMANSDVTNAVAELKRNNTYGFNLYAKSAVSNMAMAVNQAKFVAGIASNYRAKLYEPTPAQSKLMDDIANNVKDWIVALNQQLKDLKSGRKDALRTFFQTDLYKIKGIY